MAAHPGVTVKLNRIALRPYNQTLTTQMQAGNGPDVIATSTRAPARPAGRPVRQGRRAPAADDPALKQVIPDRLRAELLLQRPAVRRSRTRTAFAAIIYNDELAKQNGVSLDLDVHPPGRPRRSARRRRRTGKSIFGLAGSSRRTRASCR